MVTAYELYHTRDNNSRDSVSLHAILLSCGQKTPKPDMYSPGYESTTK
jgi:hypothetical protein